MTEAAQTRIPSEAPARPARKRAPRPPPVEAKPIIGGRLWIAIVMLSLIGTMANPRLNVWISQRFAPKEPRTNMAMWKVGSEAKLHVTLVTADADRLACASDVEVDGAHCEFKGDRTPWPETTDAPVEDNRPNVIQPYRTSPENHLVLIAGLWAQPDVAMRHHKEPHQGVPAKRLNRFEAACTVRFVGEAKGVELRWDSGAAWGKEPRALIARPLHCDIVR
jgi:hypothetical protein